MESFTINECSPKLQSLLKKIVDSKKGVILMKLGGNYFYML